MASETVRDFLALADEAAARVATKTDSAAGESPGASSASLNSEQARLSLDSHAGGLLEERQALLAAPAARGLAFSKPEISEERTVEE